MAVGIREFRERTGEGRGEPILDSENDEEIMNVSPQVSIVLGNRAPESPGTLYITSKKVIWLSDVDMQKGYAVDFLSISLHAISRDPEAYSFPCIYAQIDTGDEEDESEDSDSESNDALDLSKISEMRVVPSDPTHLDDLFMIFCDCAELNPDPVEEGQEEEHNWIFSANQMVDEVEGDEDLEWSVSQNSTTTIGHSNGDHDLARTVLELRINDQRFEDAEEMDRDADSGPH